MGILVLWDLAVRLRYADAHYSDEGVLPIAAAERFFPDTVSWSFHMLSGDVRWFYALSMLLAISATLMILGSNTRKAVALVWLLSVSMQCRNEIVLYGGDHYRRALLFWAVFLPLGEAWSLDARHRSSLRRARVFSVWTIGALLQVLCVYAFAGLLKTGTEWRSEGSALYYALNIDDLSRTWSAVLLRFPEALRLLSLCVVPVEVFAPLLLLSPLKLTKLRLSGLILLASIHIGTIAALYLFQIPWAGLCSLLLFVPPGVWDKFQCGTSEGSTEPDKTRCSIRSGMEWCVGAFFIGLLFVWNLSILLPQSDLIPPALKRVGLLLRFDQDWSFYAPYPYKTDGWYIIDGKLGDGTAVDVWNGTVGAPSAEKPSDIREHYRNEHWEPYLFYLWTQTYGDQSPLFASYLCRNWRKEHGTSLNQIRIRFQAETTQPRFQSPTRQTIELFNGACPGSELTASPPPSPTESVLTFTGCRGSSREIKISFPAHVTLNRAFLEPDRAESAQIMDAIQRQIRFAVGRFMSLHEGPLLIRPSSHEPEIQVLDVKDVSYPFDAVITPVVHPDVTIESPYILAALDRKITHTTDTAIQANYNASLTAIACAANPDVVPEVTVDMPVDPYLYYWTVSPEGFRDISWRSSRFHINPCADEELADIPHPDYVWYFWNPKKSGIDADGRPFDCGHLLKEGTHYLQSPATLTGLRQIGGADIFDGANLSPREPLKIDIIFGILDAKATNALSLSPEQRAAALHKFGSRDLDRFLTHPDVSIDRGSTYFLSFLNHLDEVLDVSSNREERTGRHLLLTLWGALQRSGRAVTMRIYFGPTDLLSGDPPEHWELLRDALATSDVVLYNGHSGLGANMSYANIFPVGPEDAATDHFTRLTVPQYQLIGYLSCYSWTYFGYDTVDARNRARGDAITDIVFTGSNFTSERGPLAILSYIDQLLSGDSPSAPPFSAYIIPDDFFVVERFGPPTPAE
ncbi:MAG: HTTM domain-containing protein [Bdellovibrionota bacterium]